MKNRIALGTATAGAAALLLGAGPASARPAHLKALNSYYGSFLATRLQNCTTCHLPSSVKSPTSLAEFPHNPFGKRLLAVREELAAAGKRTDLGARLQAVAAEDSDGDGTPNQLELLAGHAPGNATDLPSPAEKKTALAQLPRFQAFLAAYRWKPFEAVVRPAVPKAKDRKWVRNPIDEFVAVEREKRGLQPRPEASREVLLRRVYLDLTGLSPTPEERRAFLADRSPDAYEKLVDRLLASPRYGERWGRHWMDVWRYSDWAGWGEQVRDSKPHIWRWRDWIVDSLNADMGYDRMVQEMLAGDELAPGDPKVLPATGFLVRNFKLLSREKWLQDTVDHTGQAFLGLTVGCARCHDHMYDPITQNDYYRFRAIFEPHQVRTDWVPGELDVNKDGLPRAYDAEPNAATYLFIRGDERQPVKDKPLAPGVPESLGGTFKPEATPLPLQARFPEKQPHVIATLRAQAERRVAEARKALQGCTGPEEVQAAEIRLKAAETASAALEAVLRVEALEDAGKKDSAEWKQAAEAAQTAQRNEAAAQARAARLEAALALAALQKKADTKPDALKKSQDALAAAEAALAKAVGALKEPVTTAYKARVIPSYPATSTGRRLALARWITDSKNPLAARVAVNHVWLRHFGKALVPSVADFGANGTPPTHPLLLDWLASEFMANGWSFKRLHRQILTSATYRMASTPDEVNLAKDPDNRYLWRMDSRRLEAEAVRDNVLFVTGQLDLKMGGADIDQNLGLTVKRRSIYFRHAMEKEMVFLELFDGPSVTECYARKQTVVPQQALALANSELTLTQARLLAAKLAEQAGPDPSRFINLAFEQVLSRAPTRAEQQECLSFLSKPPATNGKQDPALRARENLVLVLLNHNDFITIR